MGPTIKSGRVRYGRIGYVGNHKNGSISIGFFLLLVVSLCIFFGASGPEDADTEDPLKRHSNPWALEFMELKGTL